VGTAWSSVTGLHDVYLIKTDSLGNLLWSNTYGGIYEDRGNSVRQTEDGGYIITGITYSFGGVGGDIYLIKTDSLGNQQWSRNFGTDEYDEGNCVKQTFDNGYVIVGKSRYYIPPSYDTYVTKVDSAGNQQWIFVFAGLGHDYGNWIEQLEDGSFIITGFGAPHGITYGDVLLFKLESETELLSISLSPVNPPITIPSVGGNFQFNGVVNNLGQGATVFDTWFNVSVPGITNPVNVLQRPNITLSVGGNLTRTLTQFVPGGAPAGTYIYRGFAGEFPNYVVDCDSFTFVKSP
jgi:hypothetical protein